MMTATIIIIPMAIQSVTMDMMGQKQKVRVREKKIPMKMCLMVMKEKKNNNKFVFHVFCFYFSSSLETCEPQMKKKWEKKILMINQLMKRLSFYSFLAKIKLI